MERGIGFVKTACLFLGSFAFMTCGPPDTAVMEEAKSYKFAFIPQQPLPVYYEPHKDGARSKANEITVKGPDSVEIAVFEQPIPNQLQAINDALAAGVHGMIISPQDSKSIVPTVNMAADAGIPTVLFESTLDPPSKHITLVEVDSVGNGRLSAKLMSKALGPAGGKILVLRGDLSSADATINGFMAESTENNLQLTIADIVICKTSDSPAACSQKMEASMAANPDATGWYFPFVWRRIGLHDATKTTIAPTWRTGKYKTVAGNAQSDTLDVIRNGLVYAIITPNFWDLGYTPTQLLYNYLKTKQTYSPSISAQTAVVCLNNVENFAATWATNDFSVPLPPCSYLK